MRHYYILPFICFACIFKNAPTFAQTINSDKDLIEAVATFNSTSKNQDYLKLISRFEQIEKSTTNNKDWIPAYYISLVYARLSFKNKNRDELYADQSIQWAKKSLAIEPNAENYCALSMAQTAKMAVNPYLRWLRYEKAIYEPLEKAKKMDSNNPRVYILEASLKMNIPTFFGGGCDKSKPMLMKAKQLLAMQTPDSILPNWGLTTLAELRGACPF
jgi:hypothetical protein